jgi:hypothetical protein
MSRLRYLADHDLNEHIVAGVLRRNPSIEFLRVRDFGLHEVTDREVLSFATLSSLVVVSHDVNTMTAAALKMRSEGTLFSGLFLVPQSMRVRDAIESLVLAWAVSDDSEWQNQTVFLPF